MEEEEIDEALLPLHRFIADLVEAGLGLESDGVRMGIESLGIEMPLTLDVVMQQDGRLAIGAAPPLYYFETSLAQVHHPLKVLITRDGSW